MTDLRPTIVPKSDQLNADDLIGTTKTVKITKVLLREAADQPVAIHYEGDDGKPYLPCKSMRRVMVHIWGDDGNKFVGRRMTLYRDDKVQFGGTAVGGIRISHMSDIDRDVVMSLTATRASRKPFTVKPLPAEFSDEEVYLGAGRAAARKGKEALKQWSDALPKAIRASLKSVIVSELIPAAEAAETPAAAEDDEDPFGLPDDGFTRA